MTFYGMFGGYEQLLSFNVIPYQIWIHKYIARNYLVVVASSKSLWLWVFVYYVDEIINWYCIRNKTVSTQPQNHHISLLYVRLRIAFAHIYELYAIHTSAHCNRALLKKIKDWNIGKSYIPIHSFCYLLCVWQWL